MTMTMMILLPFSPFFFQHCVLVLFEVWHLMLSIHPWQLDFIAVTEVGWLFTFPLCFFIHDCYLDFLPGLRGEPVFDLIWYNFSDDFENFCMQASKLAEQSNGAPLFTIAQSPCLPRHAHQHNDAMSFDHQHGHSIDEDAESNFEARPDEDDWQIL